MPQTGKAVVLQLNPVSWCCWEKPGAPYLVHVFSLHHHFCVGCFVLFCFVFSHCLFLLLQTVFDHLYLFLHVLVLFLSFSCNGLIFPAVCFFLHFYSSFSPQIRQLNLLRETSPSLKHRLLTWQTGVSSPRGNFHSSPKSSFKNHWKHKPDRTKKKRGFNKMSFRV